MFFRDKDRPDIRLLGRVFRRLTLCVSFLISAEICIASGGTTGQAISDQQERTECEYQ